MKVEPQYCLVVEDAVAGVIAAQAANMKVLGIGDPSSLPNAPKLVKNLSEITVDEILNL